jgi:CRISPR type I-E-associated protein CasB/Cse2
MSATEQYVKVLTCLKLGELGLLRARAGKDLSESVDGFDLFAGLWWPLRAKSAGAPRREVAWLITKLYAFRPLPHSPHNTLASQLRRCQPREERERHRFQQKFDEMLTHDLDKIEPAIQWALDTIESSELKVDWVRLTNDLSIWERESTRLKWAKDFCEPLKEKDDVN